MFSRNICGGTPADFTWTRPPVSLTSNSTPVTPPPRLTEPGATMPPRRIVVPFNLPVLGYVLNRLLHILYAAQRRELRTNHDECDHQEKNAERVEAQREPELLRHRSRIRLLLMQRVPPANGEVDDRHVDIG